ncbi:MAG: DUF3131 domain-containing protein [Roseinatronobacter sp.]
MTTRRMRVPPLSRRVKDNASVLLAAYRSCAQDLQSGVTISPAAEWLLDNFYLVELQLQQIKHDLPPGYYRQLPKLAEGPLAGYPRVMGIAWAYVAHTDSLLNKLVLVQVMRAYQTVEPLTIGEHWAVAITLRIVLLENMRRLADQIISGQHQRADADRLVDSLVPPAVPATGVGYSGTLSLLEAVAPFGADPLPEITAAQIAKRLRGCDPADTPLCDWLDDRLRAQGLTREEVIVHAQQRQGASNVTMRNIVTSMRFLSEMDWQDFFEEVSLVDAHLQKGSNFAEPDFATRNSYRTEIESLARRSDLSEGEVTQAALEFAAAGNCARTRDPGHALIGSGRVALERAIGYAPAPGQRISRMIGRVGLSGYLVMICMTGAVFLGLALYASSIQGLAALILALVGIALAFEAGRASVDMVVTRAVAPTRLPGLALSKGIPPELRSLVAVPVLLKDADEVVASIEQLEIHHLSSTDGALQYCLLCDWQDSATETQDDDAALADLAREAIARLNAAYPSADGDRFMFLHRRRQWNPSMGLWMGWERKRGKLIELNRLLRGATDTSFQDPGTVPQDIRFVITLDADTRLLRDTVRLLIGKIAHPLNRPHFDSTFGRVIEGYGILQPRVTPALPIGAEGSLLRQVNSSHGGIDAYAAAISDVYQDLFGEGSFTGKGIYDVDAFMVSLAGRVPENTMLSHDLFEGTYARAGLVSDVEVVEDFPARHDVAARRQHRWVRGDWQLLPWLLTRADPRRSPMPALGRWKVIDNLRRSLTPPLTLAALVVGWAMLPLAQSALWTAALLALLALPHLLSLPFAFLPGRAGITARSHLAAFAADARSACFQILLKVTFLPDTAMRNLDAIARTLWRIGYSRQKLLEWVTAAQSAQGGRPGMLAHYGGMAPGVALGLVPAGAVVLHNPDLWSLVLPFALMWSASPAIAHRISQPALARRGAAITGADAQGLRLIARSTWRYFESFVTEADNFLPPDNYQETPLPALARRTSPTNVGMYLLSVTAAHDLGWIGRANATTRLEQTLATMQRMPQFRGHLYNWHATDDLRVLEPAYVSSVDSGNLAGHLIAVAQACAEWQRHPQPVAADWRAGLSDTLLLAERALARTVRPDLHDLVVGFNKAASSDAPLPVLLALATVMADRVDRVPATDTELGFWVHAVKDCLISHAADEGTSLGPRLARVERMAREFALDMDFGFMLVPDKKLLSIGFAVATNRLDANCYDLLASEARLASLFAIAKGDVETQHWFRLGRSATPIGAGSALVSWSGSMFEYLMPSLILREPAGSLLEETNRRIVARQREYGAALGIPWGVSESGYNARDLDMT